MKILRIITVIIIFIGGVMQIKDLEGSEIVLMTGIILGLYLAVKNYNNK